MAKNILWNSYWGTFNRVLGHVDRSDVRGIVEVNLTAVNGIDGDWDRVRYCRVRVHGTSRGRNDTFHETLPKEWWDILGQKVGGDVRHFLITAKILPMIDWEKYNIECNGGADLYKILAEGQEIPRCMIPGV